MMEQTDFMLPDGEHDLLRRIRLLAERAERTAHNRSNFVGPPPSQEHLDILAEIRALSEEMTTATSSAVMSGTPTPVTATPTATPMTASSRTAAPRTGRRAEALPRPARPADDLIVPGKN
ncbi:hypothetical protein [Lentzea sp. E54]|uniref:hypothetical protein n=1 Tax=Lentzea xerophila TaxID=3435883 RepID=UPI003DA4C943